MKIAYLDIETSPMLGWVWGKYQQDVLSFEKDFFVMCLAVRWNDGKKIEVYSLPDFKTYDNDHEDDRELMKVAWEILDEADIIIAHNGDKFDIKKLNARLLALGFPPPSPYQTIDTLKVARKYFKMTSNKLDDIGNILGVGRKVGHSGYKLWRDCILGDEKSWGLMKRYNAQDVRLLYNVYQKLRPWIRNHPNINDLEDRKCPNCGSSKIQSRGTERTKSASYRRYHCQSCGAWSKGKRIESSDIK